VAESRPGALLLLEKLHSQPHPRYSHLRASYENDVLIDEELIALEMQHVQHESFLVN